MNKTVKAPKLPKPKKLKSSKALARKESAEMTLLALPGILLLLIFNYIPMIGIITAFKNYKAIKGMFDSDWYGLQNFEFFFTSQDAVRTIRNTVGYGVLFLTVGLCCSVGLALLFYSLKSRQALKVYNTVMIMPKFLSIVIIAYMAYTLLSPTFGLLNSFLKAIGAEPVKWYSEPKYWPFIILIVQVWRTVGMASIIYYASLMGVDEGLLEAARLDGANKLQEIWHILIPHLIPTMVVQTILNMGQIFSGDFGLFYQVPRNQGPLYSTTDIINTYTYRALKDGQMGKSTAIGLFQSLAGLIMVCSTNAIVRKVSPDNKMF